MKKPIEITTTRLLILLIIGLALKPTHLLAQHSNEHQVQKEWIQLFNGKNLDGWIPKFTGHAVGLNYKNTFRIEDGYLTISYENWERFNGEFGHLFYKQPFSNFRLRLEYRFIGDQVKDGPAWAFRNNGIMIYGQTPESMKLDQEFPTSIEVQLLGGNHTGERSTANVCTPGTHVVIDGELVKQHCINSESQTYHGNQWVNGEIVVKNGTIKHYINGNLVMEYQEPQLDSGDQTKRGENLLTEGTISIQAESHPTQFSKIEIMPLDKK